MEGKAVGEGLGCLKDALGGWEKILHVLYCIMCTRYRVLGTEYRVYSKQTVSVCLSQMLSEIDKDEHMKIEYGGKKLCTQYICQRLTYPLILKYVSLHRSTGRVLLFIRLLLSIHPLP